MRRLAVLVLFVFVGCGVAETPDHSTLDIPKACSCAGNMSCCSHDGDGCLLCKPESCTCRQVALRR